MKKIYMYAHGGSGNHGCEAIVRSTIKILKGMGYDELVLISAKPKEDFKYGINLLCEIVEDRHTYSKFSMDFLKAYYKLKIKKDFIPMDALAYKKSISHIKPGDIVLSIGGDNYCYADVKKYVMLHDLMLRKGAKTVLWGCSVEPHLLKDSEIADDLKRYSLIVARESISYAALKQINKNTILASDPAFFLNSSGKKDSRNIVGINLSPMILNNEKHSGIVLSCYRKLIQYILEFTDMNIILIPHVVWHDNDDREALERLYNEFEEQNRIEILPDCSCEMIKGVIGNCKYFVGARTHSTIAAYSMQVPTLVIGYSVKSRGIAKDIFGKEEYIIPVQEIISEDCMVLEFKKLMDNREEIVRKMGKYKLFAEQSLNKLKNEFKKLED